MKITEQSETKLAFKIGLPFFNSSDCEFDRSAGRAVIKRWTLFWPRKAVDVPLDEVADARVGAASFSSEGSQGTQYYPIIRLKSGKQINVAAFNEAAARKAVDAINAFLAQAGPRGPAAARGSG